MFPRFTLQFVLKGCKCVNVVEVWFRAGLELETGSAYCIHSYRENLIKATLPLSYITMGKQIWILHSVSSFKHPACDLLGGTMEETDEGRGACIDFFSLLFHLNASHFPPSSFVEHLSFPIKRHQSLYPCWVKNCTHYLWLVVYRNGILSTDKREVKQRTVAHKTAGRRQRSINHYRVLDNFHTVNRG